MSTAAVLRRDVSAYDGSESVRIPRWVSDLKSFRRWAYSDEFPSRGWITFHNGDIWVDMSIEEYLHNLLKGQICSVLTLLADTEQSGRFFHDRFRVSHAGAGLSAEPDGMFVSFTRFRSRRARLVTGGTDSLIELEGSPDMVLEVVSAGSVHKDLDALWEAYWKAGVREYWLVDPRIRPLRFDICRRGPRGFTIVRRRAGWLKSAVFNKHFRLVGGTDPLGHPQYRLEVR